MFDISFSEMLLCFVVALVVLGPERMPAVARAVGRWTGKAKGYVRNLTAELERETHIAEMKKQVEDAHRILKEQSNEVRSNVDANMKAIRGDLHSTTGTIDPVPAANPESLAEKPVSTAAPSAEIATALAPGPVEPAAPAATAASAKPENQSKPIPQNLYGP